MARRKPIKKPKKSITSYIFLLIGVVVVLAVAVSWLAFPGWHAQPGGFWVLLGLAAVGVVGIVKDIVAIIKDVKDMKASKNRTPAAPRNTQKSVDSEDVQQSMHKGNGIQLQTVEHSKNVHQSMK
jgi:uncharacterized membrane protein